MPSVKPLLSRGEGNKSSSRPGRALLPAGSPAGTSTVTVTQAGFRFPDPPVSTLPVSFHTIKTLDLPIHGWKVKRYRPAQATAPSPHPRLCRVYTEICTLTQYRCWGALVHSGLPGKTEEIRKRPRAGSKQSLVSFSGINLIMQLGHSV